jgi:hypothetical protein
LARHVRTSRSSAGGLIGCEAEGGGGSVVRIAEISDAWLAPLNALRPVTISYSTEPSAKMSVRASARLPSSCSGAMYGHGPDDRALGGEVAAHRRRRGEVPRPRRVRESAREAEVEQLHSGRRQHHVAGLQVAMHDPLPVRSFQRGGDLRPDPQGGVERQRAAAEPVGERLALEQLHDQVLDAVLAADVVDRADVRMREL